MKLGWDTGKEETACKQGSVLLPTRSELVPPVETAPSHWARKRNVQLSSLLPFLGAAIFFSFAMFFLLSPSPADRPGGVKDLVLTHRVGLVARIAPNGSGRSGGGGRQQVWNPQMSPTSACPQSLTEPAPAGPMASAPKACGLD